jgi:hypothetical protein
VMPISKPYYGRFLYIRAIFYPMYTFQINVTNKLSSERMYDMYLEGPWMKSVRCVFGGGRQISQSFTRAVCKVRAPTLLLRVGTLWRCGDGLFFEVPLLASDALLTTLHPLLENVQQTVDHFEICLGAPFSRLEMPRNRTGLDLS